MPDPVPGPLIQSGWIRITHAPQRSVCGKNAPTSQKIYLERFPKNKSTTGKFPGPDKIIPKFFPMENSIRGKALKLKKIL